MGKIRLLILVEKLAIVAFLAVLLALIVRTLDPQGSMTKTMAVEALAIGVALIVVEALFLIPDFWAAGREEKHLAKTIVDEFCRRSGVDLTDTNNPLVLANYKGVTKLLTDLNFPEIEGVSRRVRRFDVLNTWLPNAPSTLRILDNILANGGTVRILLAHARSAYVDARHNTLGDDVKRHIIDSYGLVRSVYLAHMAKGSDDIRQRFKVRLYNGAPPCSLYGLGDDCYAGLYAVDAYAVDRYQLKFSRESEIGLYLWGQFDSLWGNATNDDIDITLPTAQWGFAHDE